MASEQAEAVKVALRAFREQVLVGQPTLEEQRAGGLAFGDMTAPPTSVTYTDVDAGGVPAEWVVPEGAADDRVLLYVHGGGYVICSMRTHSKLVGHIAKAAGVKALNVDYRLAPEHPHPAAVNDSVAAYQWLLDQGYAAQNIAIAGDSAGGGLTFATLLAIRDRGLPLPATAVPLSPWVDLEGTGDTMTTHADRDLLVNGVGLKAMADLFLAGGDARDPLAAPLHADLRGLPPLYIQVGDDETLLDDSRRIAAKAKAEGVDVRLDVFPEMQHVFQMGAGNVPEADDAVARIGEHLRKHLR
ncbi:MAG: epsilon-lactone hydrolase [Acidimicrobiaceae bacterium]|jgi:acetyl esterase/lipase|nr:epsilon-lactone hydrolase [Acidimicrobiaceae bacterium]